MITYSSEVVLLSSFCRKDF